VATSAFSFRPLARLDSDVRTLLFGSGVGLTGGAGLAVAASQTSPVIGAAAIVGGLACLLMVFSPVVGLVAVAGTIPIERLGRLTEDFSRMTISLSRIIGLAGLGTFTMYAIMHRVKPRFGTAFWLYAGYTLVAFTTIIHAFEPKDALRDSFRILGNLLFFFYIINVVRGIKMARIAIIAWLFVSVGTVGYAAYDYHFGSRGAGVEEAEMGAMSKRFTTAVSDDSETRTLGVKITRVYGTTSHPTLFGLNLTMTLPFFAYLIRMQPWKYKVPLFLGMLAICYGIILSNTRAVMLLAVATLAVSVFRGLWSLNAKSMAALAVLLLALTPLIPKDVYLRTFDISLYSAKQSDSIRFRFKYWEKSWELIQKYWITGIGIGDQTTIVKMVTDEVAGRITPDGLKASAHNEYIWVLVEVGIVGYILHFGFVGVAVWASFKAAKLLRRRADAQEEYWLLIAAQITLCGVLVFALQTEAFHFALKGWWLAAGLSWVLLENAKRVAREPQSCVAPHMKVA
jgi:O-antigen ligase